MKYPIFYKFLPSLIVILLALTIPMTSTTRAISASSQIKQVALTFDDGPYGAPTQEIVDILKKENVHATFFMMGKNVEKYPHLAKEIAQNGNSIGNHTYDHPRNLTQMSSTQLNEEISKTDRAIASSTDIHTKLFRPPYDRLTNALRKKMEAKGYTIVLWNIDPKDWDYANSPSSLIEQTIFTNEKPTMVIVMHDGRDTQINYPRNNTIDALPVIIHHLKQQGYTFVTIDQLSTTTLAQFQ